MLLIVKRILRWLCWKISRLIEINMSIDISGKHTGCYVAASILSLEEPFEFSRHTFFIIVYKIIIIMYTERQRC